MDCLLLQGPPGTGKSTLLLALLNVLHNAAQQAFYDSVLSALSDRASTLASQERDLHRERDMHRDGGGIREDGTGWTEREGGEGDKGAIGCLAGQRRGALRWGEGREGVGGR